MSIGPKTWGWTATDLEGHEAISDENSREMRKTEGQGRGVKGRRWKANTLP